jgi:hypothetical protein
MKICEHIGCTNPQFGGGRCKYHQFERHRQGGDLFKRKPPKIANRTPKRTKDERQYKDQAREFFDNAVKEGTNLCFFCGKKVTKFEGLHHLKGRTNDYLLDRLWWVTVHNFCHTACYHQMDYEHRSQQPWWAEFLQRLRLKSEELYQKEINKEIKSQKFNPQFRFDEKDDDLFG